jgi:hypothetical protein
MDTIVGKVILDVIKEHGRCTRGMLHNGIDPEQREKVCKNFTVQDEIVKVVTGHMMNPTSVLRKKCERVFGGKGRNIMRLLPVIVRGRNKQKFAWYNYLSCLDFTMPNAPHWTELFIENIGKFGQAVRAPFRLAYHSLVIKYGVWVIYLRKLRAIVNAHSMRKVLALKGVWLENHKLSVYF